MRDLLLQCRDDVIMLAQIADIEAERESEQRDHEQSDGAVRNGHEHEC